MKNDANAVNWAHTFLIYGLIKSNASCWSNGLLRVIFLEAYAPNDFCSAFASKQGKGMFIRIIILSEVSDFLNLNFAY